ncbi:Gfo/Idh/MocA family protein [Streptomyces sp. NPDC127108]|uniref:Gfo/Idh/MocA family protein n=1 Tax=Streptomyces sp. NPDC127108 TaxID=3345361 RepID=UPI003639FDCE
MNTLRPVIVGYGHAGRDLHHRSLRALGLADDVLVVDPVHRAGVPDGARRLPDLASAMALLPDVSAGVFHVTTSVDQHLPVTEQLVAAGARNIIVEKPITNTLEQAVEMHRLAERARIHAVSVWPVSRVTERVTELIAQGRIGTLVKLHVEQSKPRFRRTLCDRGHRTAFHIEMPHQVLLALHLAGAVDHIADTHAWDSPLPECVGGAEMVLRHTNGVTSTLHSDLTSPIRIRRLRLTGTTGEIVADYSVSADDDFGQVRVIGDDREVLPDAPLTRFIELAYAHAAGQAPPPPAPLASHVSVISLLTQAMSITNSERTVPC